MKLIGRGRTADVYLHEDKAIKVFHDGISDEWITYEYHVNEIASQYGGPKVYGYEKLDDKKGIAFEYINGEMLSEYMKKHLSRIRSFGKITGGLHAKVHECHVNDLVSQQSYFTKQIKRIECLPEDVKEKILEYMLTLPTGEALCHGDLHVENILVSDTWRVIDWTNAYSGNPGSDVARSLMIMSSPVVKDSVSFILKPFVRSIVTMFKMHYLISYVSRSHYKRRDFKAWKLIACACRLNENIKCEKAWLLANVFSEIKRLRL